MRAPRVDGERQSGERWPMESANEPVCVECGAKAATVHLTVVEFGGRTSRNLCPACFEATPSGLAKDFMEAMRQARCRFCGGKATMSDSMTGMLDGGNAPDFLCLSCGGEYHRVLMSRLEAAGASLERAGQAAQLQHIRRLKAEAEELMRQWRRSRDN